MSRELHEAFAAVSVEHAIRAAYKCWFGDIDTVQNLTEARAYFNLAKNLAEHETYEEACQTQRTQQILRDYHQQQRDLAIYFEQHDEEARKVAYHRFCARMNRHNMRRFFETIIIFATYIDLIVTLTSLIVSSFIDISDIIANMDPTHLAHIGEVLLHISKAFCIIIAIFIILELSVCIVDTVIGLLHEQNISPRIIAKTFFNMLCMEDRPYRLAKNSALLLSAVLSIAFPGIGTILSAAFYISCLVIFGIRNHNEKQHLTRKKQLIQHELDQLPLKIYACRLRLDPSLKSEEVSQDMKNLIEVQRRLEQQLITLNSEQRKLEFSNSVKGFMLMLLCAGGLLAMGNPMIGVVFLLLVVTALVIYQSKLQANKKDHRFIPTVADISHTEPDERPPLATIGLFTMPRSTLRRPSPIIPTTEAPSELELIPVTTSLEDDRPSSVPVPA